MPSPFEGYTVYGEGEHEHASANNIEDRFNHPQSQQSL